MVLPGGFSYGDYLRTGAIARFSPVMQEVAAFAESGGLVLGICNGFQILTEAHLLHGAMLRNRGLKFICHPQYLRVERTDTPFTSQLRVGQVIQVPVNHNEGAWTAGAESLQTIEDERLVVFRYCDADGQVTDAANPNGAVDNVAGILNEAGNVLGMMPHPERVCEEILGGTDGRGIFGSLVDHVLRRGAALGSSGRHGCVAGGVVSGPVKCPRCGHVDSFMKGYLSETCVCRVCQSQLDWREVPGLGPDCRPLDEAESEEGGSWTVASRRRDAAESRRRTPGVLDARTLRATRSLPQPNTSVSGPSSGVSPPM